MPTSCIVSLSSDAPDPITGNRRTYEVGQGEFERLVSLGLVALGGHLHTATQIIDSTATGRSVVTATDAAAARTAIGAAPSDVVTSIGSAPSRVGQIAVVAGTAYIATGTAAAADWKAATT